MDRFRRRPSGRLALAALILGFAARAGGQQVETKAAKADAPKEAFTQVRALADVQFSDRYYERKQQALREHHLELPIGGLPAGRAAMAEPARDTETPDPGQIRPRAPGDIELVRNRALSDQETSNITSNVSEPSVASRGREVLVTANWFAAFSKNGGSSFKFLNPDTTFPDIPGRAFCCDQVALYDRKNDLMMWFLQYSKDATGNTIRLAVATGNDIRDEKWRFYDFTPQGVGNWAGEWFDYPDLAVSGKHLFLTTNSFSVGGNAFRRSVALRIPLSELKAYASLSYRFFDAQDVGGLRPTQGATDAMYIGTHSNLGSLRVYTWPDADDAPTRKEVEVEPWSDATRVAPGPDGRDWLGFADGRITAAWAGGDTIGFGWTAAQDASFAFPHARFAILNKATKAVVAQPHIWNNTFAFAYPAAAPNADGKVGLSISYGGGSSLFPSAAVGVLDMPGGGGAAARWRLARVASGTSGPDRNRWGDYLAVRPHGRDGKAWAATAFTLNGGPARTDIEVRYVQFRVAPARPADSRPGAEGNASAPATRADIEQLRGEIQELRRLLLQQQQRRR